MKSTVKNIIEKYPILKRNRFYYHLQKLRQEREFKVSYSLTDRPDLLDKLVEDGIVLIKNYLSKEICEKIILELQETANQILNGKPKETDGIAHLPEKAFRIAFVDKISPTANEKFFEDKMISELAQAYITKKAFSYRREADYKTEAGHFLQSDLPHFDDWRHKFKAFLYLTDVGEENAPFAYYKGSHQQLPWRYRYNVEFEMDGQNGRFGHFFPQEMRKIQQDQNFEELVCLGEAGTLILADFRGIHRGTSLMRGQRIMLNNTFAGF